MELYRILSALLCYPDEELIQSIDSLKDILSTDQTVDTSFLQPLFKEFKENDLISLQETYVQTFDRTPTHSLHLFEHIHGEDRIRGQALSDLLSEYKKLGFETISKELPDYLPLFLEFLALCDAEKAQELLDSAIHVIAHIKNKLEQAESPYAGIFNILLSLSSIQPQPLIAASIRDMDDLIDKMGITPEGLEPLLPFGPSNSCNSCMPKRGSIA